MVSPCLEATYGVAGRCGPVDLSPYIEDTLMILPRPSRSPRSLEIESNHTQWAYGKGYISLLVNHHGQLLLLTPPNPEEVDVRNLRPFGVGHLMRHLPAPADPCIIDRDVEPAESPHSL